MPLKTLGPIGPRAVGERVKDLSLQHRQSVIAEKELCARCLRHSDLDESKKRDCIRKITPPHWLGSSVRQPGRSPSGERELPPPVEAKAGRSTYACRIDIRVKTKLDLHKEKYGASLTTLFSASRQMSAIVQTAAVEKGVPYRTVPEVTVMLGVGPREKSTKLFFLEIKAYRNARPLKEPEPLLVAVYGVKELAPATTAAPELYLLLERFLRSRPALTMGGLSQKEGPVELVVAQDYKRYWPLLVDTSCFAPDKLYLMKMVFHPGQLLCSEADPEALGTKMRGVKRRLTQGTGESAGSSTSSSRRPQEATPVADPSERWQHDSPSPIRRGGEEKKRAKSPSPRSTSAASTNAQLPHEMSVPSRGDKKDMSIQEKDEKDKSGETSAAVAEEVQRVRHQGRPAPPAAGDTSEAVSVKPERLRRLDKPSQPAAGETSAAAATSPSGLVEGASPTRQRPERPARQWWTSPSG
jgi:hypothetical protein